jgi:tetratricopeptide (TPR) repeat protein
MAERRPAAFDREGQIALLHFCQAIALGATGRGDEAAAAFGHARSLGARLARDFPKSPQGFLAAVTPLHELGEVLKVNGRTDPAEQALRAAHDLLEGLGTDASKVQCGPVLCAVQHDLGTLLWQSGRYLEAEAMFSHEADQWRQLLRRYPQYPLAQNSLAWFLATCPVSHLRRPAEAVELARKAVERAPKAGAIWNTLGVAEYRAGSWDEAIKALLQSVELTSGGSPTDWFFLAMARWQKGDRQEARSWYEKAVAWMDQNCPKDDELGRVRAEAEALLRSEDFDATMPNGAAAFAR